MRTSGEGLEIVNLRAAQTALLDGAGVPVHGAPALGLALHSNGHLGADVLLIRAGDQFPVHTHPGDHLLMCLAGEGTITVANVTYPVKPGDLYMVDGGVPHAVGAGESGDHVLLAIGAPHTPVQAVERMALVGWDGRPVDQPLIPG